jgi:hypothetical protein
MSMKNLDLLLKPACLTFVSTIILEESVSNALQDFMESIAAHAQSIRALEKFVGKMEFETMGKKEMEDVTVNVQG